MFKIENNNIHMNRGDTITIQLENKTDSFAVGDKFTFYIVARGDFTNVLLKKEFTVTGEATKIFCITLDPADTKGANFPPIKIGYAEYWYEIELNSQGNVSTIMGQDCNGPKIFFMYPEAVETVANNN